jgi:hypothetical protein
MPTIEITAAQASALRRAAQHWIELTEDEFRSGEWQQWEDTDARQTYDDMARLLECMDLLLTALPVPEFLFPQEATNAND